MLRYLYQSELDAFPALRDSMYKDRATQFRDRLGWQVNVCDRGWERDDYDFLNPLYVIWQTADGRHGGSMRFLPTVGPTMVNDHFSHLMDGVTLVSPRIWECTRFCLAPNASGAVAGALMLAGGEIMTGFGLTHLVGVFDARMIRIYRAIGASPEVLGCDGAGPNAISVGLWGYSASAQSRVSARAGLSAAVSRQWFRRAFVPSPGQSGVGQALWP